MTRAQATQIAVPGVMAAMASHLVGLHPNAANCGHPLAGALSPVCGPFPAHPPRGGSGNPDSPVRLVGLTTVAVPMSHGWRRPLALPSVSTAGFLLVGAHRLEEALEL